MNLRQGTVAGGISISLGGFAASFTATEAEEWLQLLTEYAPIFMVAWLIYKLWQMEKQHRNCNRELASVKEDLKNLEVKVAVLEGLDSDDGK